MLHGSFAITCICNLTVQDDKERKDAETKHQLRKVRVTGDIEREKLTKILRERSLQREYRKVKCFWGGRLSSLSPGTNPVAPMLAPQMLAPMYFCGT
jgi:hypothetical protein